MSPGHGKNSFWVFSTSDSSDDSKKRYEQEQDENITQFMDESYHCRLLLSSNATLGGKVHVNSKSFTLYWSTWNETYDFKFIQDLLRAQVDTIVLQANKYVFRALVQEEGKKVPTTNVKPKFHISV